VWGWEIQVKNIVVSYRELGRTTRRRQRNQRHFLFIKNFTSHYAMYYDLFQFPLTKKHPDSLQPEAQRSFQ
jgi:hypothetical protein